MATNGLTSGGGWNTATVNLIEKGSEVEMNDTATPTAQVETITPEIAAAMIESGYGVRNRKVMARRVDRYARDMADGRWVLTGEAIKFDREGRLVDGQHRLFAVIQAGVTIETLVVRGVSHEVFAFMDDGQKRTAAHLLEMHGYTASKALAAAANIVANYRATGTFKMRAGYMAPRKEDILKLVDDEPIIVEGVRAAGHKAFRVLGINPSTLAALYVAFSEVDQEDADAFFDQLKSGVGLEENDPVLVLRNRLMRLKLEATNTRIDQNYVAAITIKAWNFWRAGIPVGKLNFRPGGANPEKFPVIQ